MLDLTEAAERWAESGARWPGQMPGAVRKVVPRSLRDPARLALDESAGEFDAEPMRSRASHDENSPSAEAWRRSA